MSNEALVLPLFNDATLAEVKEYMHLNKESTDYLFDDESVSTPIEVVLASMNANQNNRKKFH